MTSATNYLESITLPNFYPVCDIMQEPEGYWNCFVNNEPFDKILDTVLSSFSSRTPAEHMSFWVQGSYGCGKSHAAIVLKHLLCDDFNQISEIAKKIIPSQQRYARYEFLRKNKRYLAATIKGAEGAHRARGAANKIKGAVKAAMIEQGIPCSLKTDFDSYCELLSNDKAFKWENILFSPGSELADMCDNVEEVIHRLQSGNSQVLDIVEQLCGAESFAAQASEISVRNWLLEAEEAVRQCGYAGIIIFWDELTSLYSSMSVDSAILELLQSIAELTSNPDNREIHEIYLYLISHKDVDRLEAVSKEEIDKIRERFHVLRYIMEPVTTYAILSHLIDSKDVLREERNNFWLSPDVSSLMMMLGDDTSNLVSVQDELKKVFPLHPYTAYLCTYVARNFESSNRTVFKFINDRDTGFYRFLQDHTLPEVCTADFLWRFFLPSFEDDPTTYGGVLEKYNRCRNRFAAGSLHLRVFETILLLNALSKRANTINQPQINPSEENIVALFAGCENAEKIKEILVWIDEQGIITKNPSLLFTIESTSLPREELIKAEQKAKETYPSVYKILSSSIYSDVKNSILDHCGTLCRPSGDLLLADLTSDVGKADLKRKISSLKAGYQLTFVVCLSQRESEIPLIKRTWITDFAPSIPASCNIVAFIPSISFGEKVYNDFIRFTAHASVADNHPGSNEAKDARANAKKTLENWVKRQLRASDIYLSWSNSGFTEITYTSCFDVVRESYCKQRFRYGADQFRELSKKPTMWKNTAARAVLIDLFDTHTPEAFSSKKQLKKNAAYYPLLDLLKNTDGTYVIGNKLQISQTSCPEEHPIRVIKSYVDSRIRKYRNGDYFNLSDILKGLVNPPYGLSKNPISQFIVGYCLHEYVNQLIDAKGFKISQVNMSDVVIAICEKWETGEDKKDLTRVRFGSLEEVELSSRLARLFEVEDNPNNTDAVITDIQTKYARRANAPLWVLPKNMELDAEIRADLTRIVLFIQNFSINHHAQEQYRELIELIDKHYTDIKLSLSIEVFNRIFEQYILQQVGSEQADNLSDIRKYLEKGLSGESGFWDEYQVQKRLQEWVEQNAIQPEFPVQPSGIDVTPLPPLDVPRIDEPKNRLIEQIRCTPCDKEQYIACIVAVLKRYPQLESIVRRELGYEEL